MKDSLLSLSFPHVLYPKPTDLPWASRRQQEPIIGIGEFCDRYAELVTGAPTSFAKLLRNEYFTNHNKPLGQTFIEPQYFAPFEDEEWRGDF